MLVLDVALIHDYTVSDLQKNLCTWKITFFFPSDCIIWSYKRFYPLWLASQSTELSKGEAVLQNLCGRYIFQCLRGKICKPNLLIVGVTDLELMNYNSACQCRTASARNECNPTHLMTPASYHAAVWEKDRLSLKVLDWSWLFTWTRFAFSGFFDCSLWNVC